MAKNMAEALALSEEIMRGVEDGDLTTDRALLKTVRLARLMKDLDAEEWLDKELNGYQKEDLDDPSTLIYKTSRVFKNDKLNIFDSTAGVTKMADSLRLQLNNLRIPDSDSQSALLVVRDATSAINSTGVHLARYEKVLVAVRNELHQYAVQVYHALSFGESTSELFDSARQAIDPLLLQVNPDLTKKLDYAMHSLGGDEDEAISAAMNSLRRLIVSLAEAIFPPTEETRPNPSGGDPIKLGSEKYLNRIKAFIDDHCDSASRKRRLKQSAANINERLSSGVHSEIGRDEAKYLLLSTYIFCGEVAQLQGTSGEGDSLLEAFYLTRSQCLIKKHNVSFHQAPDWHFDGRVELVAGLLQLLLPECRRFRLLRRGCRGRLSGSSRRC